MTELQRYLIENTKPKVTKLEMAIKLKVHPSLITLWMNGDRRPGKSKHKRISQITGIPMELL